MQKKKQLYIQLQNTTGIPQPVSLFNNGYGSAGASQMALTPGQYYFSIDVTQQLQLAAFFGSDTIVMFANRGSNNVRKFVYQQGTAFTNVNQVVAAINTFGIANFYNPSGNIIQTAADNFFFQSLSITNQYVVSNITDTVVGQPFSVNGSLIYDPGWAVNGVGTFTQINPANDFWKCVNTTTKIGPMNRNTLWNAAIQAGEQLGFVWEYDSPVNATIYIGIGGSNHPFIYFNNTLIYQGDFNVMDVNISTILGGSYTDTPFTFWNILPVNVVAGKNIFFFQNANYSGVFPPPPVPGVPGGLAIEVYNNTAAEIAAATDYSGLNLLFQSISLVGTRFY